MVRINIFEAKASFSRLISRAEHGERILIARNGVAVAQLGPVEPSGRSVRFGSLAGQIEIPDDFDEWTEQDERDWFGG